MVNFRKISFYLFIALCLFASSPSGIYSQTNEQPLTLADCYKLALKQSELIAINKDLIKEAEAHYLQGLGQLLPHLYFDFTFLFYLFDSSHNKFC